MTDLKISQFVDGGAIQDTDQIATNRAGVNTRVLAGTAAAADLGTGSGQVPTNDDLGTMAYEDTGDFVPTTQLGNAPGQIPVFEADSGGNPLYPAADGSNITNIQGLPSLPISAADGGTGLSSYAVGDIIYASATTTFSKLAGVATGNVLLSGGVTTAPSYGKVGLTTHISGTLSEGNGGTNITTYATGDILYATGANTLGKLAAGTNTHVLTLAGGVPTWAAPSAGAAKFTSTDQTITAAGSLTIAHGLSGIPDIVQVFLVCVTGEANYTTGDVVLWGASTTNAVKGLSVRPDGTNINVRFCSTTSTFNLPDRTTGNDSVLTNANWRARFVAVKY